MEHSLPQPWLNIHLSTQTQTGFRYNTPEIRLAMRHAMSYFEIQSDILGLDKRNRRTVLLTMAVWWEGPHRGGSNEVDLTSSTSSHWRTRWTTCKHIYHTQLVTNVTICQFSISPFPRCIIIMCLRKHKYLFYATRWVSFGCCCRYFYRSLWLKIHYYRTVKKTLKNLTIILPSSLKCTQIYIA